MANPSAFDRDFGYLMPFLDKVAAAASALEDAAAHGEVLAQARHAQEGLRAHSFTSMALRKPSLMRLKHIEVRKIIRPGSAAT
mgnify:CR=1 FL=1